MDGVMWSRQDLLVLLDFRQRLVIVVFIFRLFPRTPEGKAAELERFAWLDLAGKVQEMLKTITVGVGYYVADNEDFVPYLAALRRAPGLQQLEEKGIVSLQMIPWETYGLVRPLPKY